MNTLSTLAANVRDTGYCMHLIVAPTKTAPYTLQIGEPMERDGMIRHAISLSRDTLEEAVGDDALMQFLAIPKKPIRHPWPETATADDERPLP